MLDMEERLGDRCEHCTRKTCTFSLEYFAKLTELEQIKAECIYRREK